MAHARRFLDVIRERRPELLEEWVRGQLETPAVRRGLIAEQQLRAEAEQLLDLLLGAAPGADLSSIDGEPWREVRSFLEELSRARAAAGSTPAETARFVLSFKRPLLQRLRKELETDAAALTDEFSAASELLEMLAVYSMDAFIRSREQIIARQQEEMMELSAPVVKLWDGVLALPLIGTLDSARTQVVMECLLQEIVSTSSRIAILDITGVPTVDTLVAQHILKTVAAARLMGAECIVSGIRPGIAQTMVHLGVELGDVVTKATLADALRYAFQEFGLEVHRHSRKT